MKVALLAVAGAAGALTRYGVGNWFGTRTFPWSTLGINLVGSFALGVILQLGDLRGWSDTRTTPLAVGFLGAFTTFSAFSYEVQELLRADRIGSAAGYVALSVGGGVLVAFAGYAAARTFA
ncbi:MAG: CrcB family protein [Acidimicrobiia bacterium]|nr:CrcB family protein [Acidimicrobiia bacterium]